MPLPQIGSLAPGTVIADCRIERLLGAGGMGEVYLATHLRLEKLVALKVLPSRSVGDPDAVSRFIREAKLAAKINHQNVIKILDVNHHGNDYFILMDYVEGSNLSEVVKKVGMPLPYRQALRLVQLAARGTSAVHECGLIHRDIKPANIMLTTKKNVILMDFGLVREVQGSDVTNPGAVLGTPAFMSPEQSRGEQLDARSDVYSLGSTLYYLLTAKLPFEGTQIEVMIQLQQSQLPRPACEVNPYVPKAVSDFLRRVMTPRREGRPSSAAALAAEIKPLLALSDGPSVEATDTADDSKLRTGPHSLPEAEIDLVPLESVRESPLDRAKPYLPWALAAAAVLVVAIVLLTRDRPQTVGTDPKGGPPTKQEPVQRPGMVYILAGAVQIGNTEDELKNLFRTVPLKDAQIALDNFLDYSIFPPRTEQVPAFWMDKYETTNAEYAEFMNATGHPAPAHWTGNRPPAGQEQFPVTNVSHSDATAYAKWKGKKLPTEKQFFRAFREDKAWLYPWGNQWDETRTVVYDNLAFNGLDRVTATPKDVSPLGVLNLAGNAAEILRDPMNRDGRDWVVVHGAAQEPGDPLRAIASNYRLMPTETYTSIRTGFRCVHEGP